MQHHAAARQVAGRRQPGGIGQAPRLEQITAHQLQGALGHSPLPQQPAKALARGPLRHQRLQDHATEAATNRQGQQQLHQRKPLLPFHNASSARQALLLGESPCPPS